MERNNHVLDQCSAKFLSARFVCEMEKLQWNTIEKNSFSVIAVKVILPNKQLVKGQFYEVFAFFRPPL